MASQNSAKNQLEPITGSRATYYPFGDYRGLPPTQTLTDRGFTGRKSNNQPSADLGLLYYNARYYAPGLARFISADTIVPDPSNPQQFNRYSYTLNNPINFTDPSGHSCANPSGVSSAQGQPPEVTQCEQQAQKILKSTVRIQIRARAFLDGGWFNLPVTISHATLQGERYLVTHNHFTEFGAGQLENDVRIAVDEIKLFTGYGEELPGNWKSFDIIKFDDASQTLKLDFGEQGVLGVIADAMGIQSATFSNSLPPIGAEVGQVDWNGYTHVDWAIVENIYNSTENPNMSILVSSSPVRRGASGGDILEWCSCR